MDRHQHRDRLPMVIGRFCGLRILTFSFFLWTTEGPCKCWAETARDGRRDTGEDRASREGPLCGRHAHPLGRTVQSCALPSPWGQSGEPENTARAISASRAGRKMMAGLELAVSEAKSHVSSVGPVAQRVDGRKTGVAEGERGPRRRARSDIPELASPFQAS